MTDLIVTRSLTKRFGATVAVNGVNMVVREGDRYGFLGPNGSGKTTLVRMLLGLVFPTSGEIELLGHSVPRQVRAALPSIGAMVEGPAAIPHLSGRTNLAIIDAAGPNTRDDRRNRRRRIEEALDRVGLAGIDRRAVRTYSLGMRQRLGLAAALLRRPRLLILDEPTNGLDPRGIREIRDLLLELNRGGTTVFMSSHLLSEVDELCDRVGIVDRGNLVLEEELAILHAPTGRVVVDTPNPAAAVSLLDGRVEEREGSRLVIRSDDPAELNALLVRGGVAVREIGQERRTLEQIVLEVTGHGTDRVTGPAANGNATAGHPGDDRVNGSQTNDDRADGAPANGGPGTDRRTNDQLDKRQTAIHNQPTYPQPTGQTPQTNLTTDSLEQGRPREGGGLPGRADDDNHADDNHANESRVDEGRAAGGRVNESRVDQGGVNESRAVDNHDVNNRDADDRVNEGRDVDEDRDVDDRDGRVVNGESA